MIGPNQATFVACHQFGFMERLDVLKCAEPGATFLLNSPYRKDEVWDNLPRSAQKAIVEKKATNRLTATPATVLRMREARRRRAETFSRARALASSPE